MAKCTSCKNKTSKLRCKSDSLPGLMLCGRHARSRNPRIWSEVNNLSKSIILISKLWKGYHVRNLIKLAGPGAMKRSLCNNTEELTSMEPISSVHIFNYFGFEENNKIYGFDVKSLVECFNRNLIPINPYTRQPLSLDNRIRLRKVIGYRIRNGLENTYNSKDVHLIQTAINTRWLQVCQICEENGFLNIPYDFITVLNKPQLFIFLSMIGNDMKSWAAEHSKLDSKRATYLSWVRKILKKFYSAETDLESYSFFVSSILLSILYDSHDTYSICFIIMSALYRL